MIAVQIDRHAGAGLEDWSEYVDLGSLEVTTVASAQSGSASVAFIDPPATPVADWTLRVTDDGDELFEGIVRSVAHDDLVDTAGPRVEKVTAVDYTALLADDVVPRCWRSASETDAQRIAWLVDTYGTHGIVAGAYVTSVIGAMPGGSDGRPEQEFGPSSLAEALAKVAKISGGRLWVDFDKQLHHEAQDAVSAAPFGLSDTPNDTTTFAYFDFSIADEAFPRVDEVVVYGAKGDDGELLTVTVSVDDLPDPAYRRRVVLSDDQLTSTAQLTALGEAYLVTHQRRRSGRLKTLQGGLAAGQTVQLTHSGLGFAAEPFRIHSLRVKADTPTTLVYEVEFGDEPPSLTGLVSGQADDISTLQQTLAGGSYADRALADLSVAGANLVRNGSFDDTIGSEWTAGANWAQVAASDAVWGAKVARASLSAQTAGSLLSASMPVDRRDDYWVSAWTYLRSRTSGTAVMELRQYDAGDVLLTTTTVASLTAAESGWTRHSLHLGPNDQTGRTAFHASTASVRVAFRTTGTATLSWDVDGVQVERGAIITAFAPRPQELLDGSVGTTKITNDAVTTDKLVASAVTAGKIAASAITADKIAASQITADHINTLDLAANKLTLRDTAGETALSAAGFGPTWRRFVFSGLYNSDFYAAPTTSGSDIATTTNELPFWTMVEAANANATARSVASATSASGRAVRITFAGSGAIARTFRQVVPVSSSSGAAIRHNVRASFRTGPSTPADTVALVEAVYRDQAGTDLHTATTQLYQLSDVDTDSTFDVKLLVNGGVIPENAWALAVRVGASRLSGSATGYVDLRDVSIVPVSNDVPTRWWKDPVRLATTAALPTNTAGYASLAGTSNALLTIDGVEVNDDDRVLVKNESAKWKNGVYVVRDRGAAPDQGIVEVTKQRTSNSTSASTQLILTFPSQPTSGHLLVAAVSWRSDATVTAPSGWTLATNGGNGSSIDSGIWYRVAGASESTKATWTFSASVKSGGIMSAFSNGTGWPANPLDKTNSGTGTGTAGSTGATGTLAQSAELVVASFASITSATWSGFDNSQTFVGQVASRSGSDNSKNTTAMTRRIVSSTASVTYGATLATSQVWSTAVATFKPNALGSAGGPWSLVRSQDMYIPGDVRAGVAVAVSEGTRNADSVWSVSTDGRIDIGASDMEFARLAPSTPVGTITMFAGSSAPAGTLLCDGSAYLRSDYPDLFAVIGTAYGAPDSTQFNVPNLQSRFPLGAGSTSLGATGGSLDHTHSTSSHSHSSGGHSHSVGSHSHSMSGHSHSGPAAHSTHTHSGPSHQHALGFDVQTSTVNYHAGYSGNVTSQRVSQVAITDTNFTGAATEQNSGPGGTGATGSGGGDSHGSTGSATDSVSSGGGGSTGSASDSIGSGGGGSTGSNNPPYVTVNFIIQT